MGSPLQGALLRAARGGATGQHEVVPLVNAAKQGLMSATLLISVICAWAGHVLHATPRAELATERSRWATPFLRMHEGQDDNSSGEGDLQRDLKKAVVGKLGSDLVSSMKPEDRQAYEAGSNAMADAIREAKEQLAARKAEIGADAALAELDESIRKEKGA